VEQLGERARRRGPVAVLGDDDGLLNVVGDVREQPPDGVEAAPRSADADELVDR
jgi:hypothetical protein